MKFTTRAAVLAVDQGTTGTRAILYDRHGKCLASAYQEFRQYYPHPGFVEHDGLEIWRTTLKVISLALERARIKFSDLVSIGITNQRETTVLWDRRTGKPVHHAIVWQDRRTADFCQKLRQRGFEKEFRDKTGLVLDPYFSATKIHWLLEHVPGLRRKAKRGQILFGTIDSWLAWKLTGGKAHVTDFTNASRTLLFNIKTHSWDKNLLRIMKIPHTLLPTPKFSADEFGQTSSQGPITGGIPIHAVMGDQQAALYGQACYKSGEVKNTYGTGCFVVMNLGKKFPKVPFGLLTTLACDKEGRPVYALEGSIFIAGAAVQWLRDGLGFFRHASETYAMATRVKDAGGVTVIPALTGLGSPYWNPNVRGIITGLTRGTKREHIVRATLEAIGHESADVLESMKSLYGHGLKTLKVDGGATSNPFLMQFQADILEIPILVSDIQESTAWGVAKLAAKKAGFWTDLASIDHHRKYRIYRPRMKSSERIARRQLWKHEIKRLFLP
ncbi:MAG: glycerol kinase GlpK [Candidatus Omnitrophica bacterium]|nr:glycerol kinase GlpK [Candidatus Omnitrophota bacterium]